MNEHVNGAAVPIPTGDAQPIPDLGAITLEELMQIKIGDLVAELESRAMHEEVLVLEGMPLAVEATGGTVKIGVVVTIDHRGDKYLEAVKARMRKEAQRRHDRELEAAKKDAQ